MHRCLQLARQGMGNVAPNPMVGAVLVNDGKIVAEGFHRQFGGPHAEVECLKNVNDAEVLQSSTLYVSLEPCSHHGKTPPCANLIIKSGIKHVVVGSTDPNPQVAGRGIALMRQHGIEVVEGVLDAEAQSLNRRFFTFHTKQRPYIVLKWAQTADGFIGKPHQPGQAAAQLQISSIASARLVHLWRSQEQSILVGKNTVLADDPALTTRHVSGHNPIRVVIDRQASIQGNYKIFDNQAETLVYGHSGQATAGQTQWVQLGNDTPLLQSLLTDLYQRNVQSILVEGGTKTLQAFIDADLWDEARVFTAPHKLNQGVVAPQLPQAKRMVVYTQASGYDVLQMVYNTTFAPSCFTL